MTISSPLTAHFDPARPLVSKRSYRWLVVAVLLFLLQSLPLLSYRWLTDESWYAGPGYTIAQGTGVSDPGMGANDPEHTLDARPPGTALVMAGFFKLFGVGQISARLGSILAGVLIVVMVFLLMRDAFGETAAAISALVIATDNLIVLTSRTARPEALTVMAVLLGMLALRQYGRGQRLVWALASGLLMALGTMFHITLAGYIVSFGFLLLVIDRRAHFPLRGALTYTLGYAAGLVPYLVWIFTAPNGAGIVSFKEEFIGKVKGTPLSIKFLHEAHRYSDVLGFDMLHGHGLQSLPVRLPIPLVFLFASYLLWRYRRSWFYLELVLLMPAMLWLIYTANKSSRYVALLAPIFAMAIGAAFWAVADKPRLRKLMLTLAGLVILAQAGANFYLLRAAHKADYNHVTAELQSVIPPGATAYGTITFWLGLRNHPFVAYERTSPAQAAQDFHARYFILGDRMMMNGSDWDSAYYKSLYRELVQLTAKGQMVGEFDDPYYGDLKVYRIPN